MVIDAKRYCGKRPRLHVEGDLFRARVEKHIVGGERTKLVDGAFRRVALAQDLVDVVPVRGALCFVKVNWPLGTDFVIVPRCLGSARP